MPVMSPPKKHKSRLSQGILYDEPGVYHFGTHSITVTAKEAAKNKKILAERKRKNKRK